MKLDDLGSGRDLVKRTMNLLQRGYELQWLPWYDWHIVERQPIICVYVNIGYTLQLTYNICLLSDYVLWIEGNVIFLHDNIHTSISL